MNKPASHHAVKIRRLPHGRGLPLPAYQSADAAGLDLVAAVPAEKPIVLKPMQRALVPTGLTLELPAGTEAQVRPRSGLAAKHGITVLNSPGTIDADYRGEVSVILINLGDTAFEVRRGERIAQMILAPVTRATLIEAEFLSATARGQGGFGSTGLSSRTAKRKPEKTKRSSKTRAPTKVASKKRSRSSASRPAKP